MGQRGGGAGTVKRNGFSFPSTETAQGLEPGVSNFLAPLPDAK